MIWRLSGFPDIIEAPVLKKTDAVTEDPFNIEVDKREYV